MFMATGIIGGSKASVAFADASSNSTSPNNTLNFVGQNLGTEDATREIIVIVYSVNSSTSTVGNTTSVTVAGVGATKIYDPGSGSVSNFTLWIASVPTGTSGTISITRSIGSGFSTCAFVAYAAYNLKSTTQFDDDTGAIAGTSSLSINLRAGGIFVAMATASNLPFTWTGATEVADQSGSVGGAIRLSGALLSGTSAATGYAVDATNAAGNAWAFGASFR